MNIIQKKREDIILNNNTAQGQLIGILEKANKSHPTLDIKDSLSGDVDFSILREYGMENIKHIRFNRGEITSVNAIPEGLLSFTCNENLLTELDNLPTGIVTLHLDHNYLSNLGLKDLTEIKVLSIQDNQIDNLEKIPETLVELNCSNNKITHLNLSDTSKLNKLIVSNNPITIIENMPDGIADFQMENTPNIEFRNSNVDLETINDGEGEGLEKKTYIDGLNEYFRMKTAYEASVHKIKKKIFNDNESKKTAKKLALSIKPPCIKCKRPVGTVFSKKENRYMAICGDSSNPCKLDIQIYIAESTNLLYALEIFKDESDTIKDAIIQQKLDTLFSYVTEETSVELFKKQLDAYNESTSILKNLLQKTDDLYSNDQKKDAIDVCRNKIFKMNENIRAIIEEYKKENNHELLKTAVSLQVNELYPEARKMFLLKNEVNEVVSSANEYQLFQYPVLLEKLDHIFSEPPRIVAFNK
jgi:hypothetical protein